MIECEFERDESAGEGDHEERGGRSGIEFAGSKNEEGERESEWELQCECEGAVVF